MPKITPDSIAMDAVLLGFHRTRLQSSEISFFWKVGQSYYFNESDEPYLFSHNVLFQKKFVNNEYRLCYHFISPNCLGKGSFGKVFDIEKTVEMAVDLSVIQAESVQPPKVIKIQSHASEKSAFDAANGEYQSTLSATHLAMEFPVVLSNEVSDADESSDDSDEGHFDQAYKSYLILNKMPGKLLGRIIPYASSLTVKEMLNLILVILNTVREQVTNQQLVHTDLNPNNMMVDNYDSLQPVVNIIDYGASLPVGSNIHTRAMIGSLGYKAPELLINKQITCTPKSDVFATAIIILNLLGMDDKRAPLAKNIHLDWHGRYLAYFRSKEFLALTKLFKADFFEYAPEFNEDEKNTIRSILQGMLAVEPKARITFDEAIDRFSALRSVYFNPRETVQVERIAQGTRRYHPEFFISELHRICEKSDQEGHLRTTLV